MVSKNKDNIFYVYEWYNLDSGEVFYVGKGKGYRYKDKISRNKFFRNYENKYNCNVRKIKENLTEKEAFELEIEKIKEYKSIEQCRCNLTMGGEGTTFEKGSWNDYFQKLRFLHDVVYEMDDMIEEKEYRVENLKNKSLEELKELYQKYLHYKDDVAMDEHLNLIKDIDGFELFQQDKELRILIDLIKNNIINKNNEFKRILKCQTATDYLLCDVNIDKFLELFLKDSILYIKLIEVLYINLLALRKYTDDIFYKFGIQVRSFIFYNSYILVKFKAPYNKKINKVKININDLLYGLIIWKDSPVFQVILKEILNSPIL